MLGVGLAGPVGSDGVPDRAADGAGPRRRRGRTRPGRRPMRSATPGRSWPACTASVRSGSRPCSRRYGTGAGHPARGVVARRRRAPGRPPDDVRRRTAARATSRPRSPRRSPGGRASRGTTAGADPRARTHGGDRRGPALPGPPGAHRDAAARAVRPGRSGRAERRGGRRHRRHAPGDRRGPAFAASLATNLVAVGASVVSGLAVGIDGAAHAAAVHAGGTTVAVIGSGHAVLHPRAHSRLARRSSSGWRGRRLGARPRTSRRARGRSRAGTGSSAASPTRRSSSRRRPGAAP